MKNLILLLIFLMMLSIYPQDKYLIFFKDKGIAQNTALLKSSGYYQKALSLLSEKAIERRSKVMDQSDLITYEDLPISEEYISQIENLNIKIHNKLKWFNAVSAYLSAEQIPVVKAFGFVDKVERVKIFRENRDIKTTAEMLKTAQDYGPSYGQYQLSGIPFVHTLGINGEGIIIGLLDSGFDWKNHEALVSAHVIAEHDFIAGDDITANQTEEENSIGQDNHGTYVFSVIGGYKEGRIISPSYKASFILAKTEDVSGEKHVEEDNYAAALEWMESMGVDITSSSLGYSNGFDSGEGDYTYADMDGKTTIATRAAELAFQRGVLVISAAGNEGDKVFHYISAPSDGINVISVGAVNGENEVAKFSSRGPSYDGRIKPDILAQGVKVYGASSGGFSSYSTSDGTSAATPIVGGIAGQILSAFPYLSNVEMRRIMLESSDTFSDPDSIRGYGLLSAPVALSVYFPLATKTATISKRIYAEKGIKQGSVKMHYNIFDVSKEEVLSSHGNNSFDFSVPDLAVGTPVNFYYTFQDQEGTTYTEPAEGKEYSYKYGDAIITYKVNFTPSEQYTLSNNYPNPFNYETKTQIRFTAKGGEKAELVIIDGIGQKVKMLFNGIAKPGVNEVTWDGFSDNGNACASGVYFYFLKIAGQDFGKKMVLLK